LFNFILGFLAKRISKLKKKGVKKTMAKTLNSLIDSVSNYLISFSAGVAVFNIHKITAKIQF